MISRVLVLSAVVLMMTSLFALGQVVEENDRVYLGVGWLSGSELPDMEIGIGQDMIADINKLSSDYRPVYEVGLGVMKRFGAETQPTVKVKVQYFEPLERGSLRGFGGGGQLVFNQRQFEGLAQGGLVENDKSRAVRVFVFSQVGGRVLYSEPALDLEDQIHNESGFAGLGTEIMATPWQNVAFKAKLSYNRTFGAVQVYRDERDRRQELGRQKEGGNYITGAVSAVCTLNDRLEVSGECGYFNDNTKFYYENEDSGELVETTHKNAMDFLSAKLTLRYFLNISK